MAAPDRFGLRFITQVWSFFCRLLEKTGGRHQFALGTLLIFALALAVYRPILPGSFLMDDWRLTMTDNPLVNGQLTPANLWFQTDFTLSDFVFWLQWLAWGQNPGWYHLVNILLHATSAVVLWRVLEKLKIPGAWLAAALFAVHPVGVNSVARIAELKNTLSLPFFLLSFLAYLHYEKIALYPVGENSSGEPRPRRLATLWYALALVAFIAALMGKTSTVMLPTVLLGCAAWQRGRIARKDWLHLSPFFVLSLAFGLMSVWFQKHQALFTAGQTLAPENFWQRLAVAGHVFGFYLGKAWLPLNLNLVYPQWQLDATAFASYLPWLIFGGGAILCWHFRHGWGRPVWFGLGCFAVTLFPALGFFDSQFLTRWQVSDHLQYLPLIAPVALATAGLAARLDKKLFRLVAVALLLTASILACQRAEIFSSEEKLLQDSVAKNPAASSARDDLGVICAQRHDISGAISEFEASLRSDPNDEIAHANLAHAFTLTEKFTEAEVHFQAALALQPYDPGAHANFADLLRQEGRLREAIYHLQVALRFKPDSQMRLDLAALFYQTGDARSAVAQLHQILVGNPDNVEALNNLAWLLATCGDETVRNATEAVQCSEKACALTGYKQARLTGTLAAAYAEAQRYPEAVAIGEQTVKLANAAGDQRIFYVGNQLLNLYRDSKPYHDPIAASTSSR